MKNLILLLSLIIFGKYAYTQNITFVNADNNIHVAEVSIISKTNANIGVISDLNGTASFEIFSLGDTEELTKKIDLIDLNQFKLVKLVKKIDFSFETISD